MVNLSLNQVWIKFDIKYIPLDARFDGAKTTSNCRHG